MAWYVWLILIVVYSALWFWLGILYKARKFRPITLVMKDPNLSKVDKAKKLIDIVI